MAISTYSRFATFAVARRWFGRVLSSAMASALLLGVTGSGAVQAELTSAGGCSANSLPQNGATSVGGASITVSSLVLPKAAFVAADPTSAIQTSSATVFAPWCELSVAAVAIGRSAPEEIPVVAQSGGADSYATALADFRASQGAELVATPTAQLFGAPVVGRSYVLQLRLRVSEPATVALSEWVAEAGGHLWIVRLGSELPATSQAPLDIGGLAQLSVAIAPDGGPVPNPPTPEPSATPMLAQRESIPAQVVQGNLPMPPWWNGDCDTVNYSAEMGTDAFRLGTVTYLGVAPCGPRYNDPTFPGDRLVHFFAGAYGEYEWECVELSMRYLYLAYGVAPYGGHGKDVVWNYPGTRLVKISNPTAGQAPVAGDVLSYGPLEPYGHTSVVQASNVNGSGNGTITVIEQNGSSTGHADLTVSNWTVQSSMSVSGWLHDPAGNPQASAGPALLSQVGTMARIYRWTSTGSAFTGPTTTDKAAFDLSSVGNRMASGDFNGDGNDDIAVAFQNASGTFSYHVWTSSGVGFVYAGVWYTSGQFSMSKVAGRLAAGDFNGDGRADVAVMYDLGSGLTRIYRWLSTGSAFGSLVTSSSISRSAASIGDRFAAGDFDGDGASDVVIASQNDSGTFTFLVFRSGLTSAGSWYTSGQFSLSRVAGRIAAGNFNNAGADDVVLGYNNGNGSMGIYRWLSTGTAFSSLVTTQASSLDSGSTGDRMAADNVNATGGDDIVFAQQNANGTFSYRVWTSATVNAGTWYSSGPFDLYYVQGRLVLGQWDS